MHRCIYIVMAVFRPNPEHLRAQLVSFTRQTHQDIHLVAVIADTISHDLVRDLTRELGIETTLTDTDFELDAVRAFEAGLEQALALIDTAQDETALIALSDQDDIWHPERLARGISEMTQSGAGLVHSDARLVDADGVNVLHRSMFAFEKRHRKPGLRGMLYRNNITGMTMLIRPDVVRIALPFPPQSGVHFYHDLWLGLVAEGMGAGIRLIRDPLVDYRQHGANAIGAVDRQAGQVRGLVGRVRRINASWLRREAASYGLARYLALTLQQRLNETVAVDQLKAGALQLRTLRPFLSHARGAGLHIRDALQLICTIRPGLARIAAGFALINAGRQIWSLRLALSQGLPDARERFDKTLFNLSPGVVPKGLEDKPGKSRRRKSLSDLIDLRKTPAWEPQFTADKAALCVLVPTLNPTEIFAGIVTALDIGLGLAERGYQVRFIATDLPVSSPGASRGFLLRRLSHNAAANGTAERVSLHCGVQTDHLPAHKGDVFLATAWWSAHIADKLIRHHGYDVDKFLYLIQDFEPNFYAWGPEYADAMASYALPFQPIFNTSLLRDYFADLGFDFATQKALAFHPSIDISRYATSQRPARAGAPKRLALYGRPEVARNMYTTAIEALSRFIETEQLEPDEIELVSVGLQHAPVRLPRGIMLNSLGKLPWEDYPPYLLETDLGLSLMYSPHPSHPPIEMAASGVRVVTNTFGPKDLSQLSPAILSAAPTAPDLAQALSRAWAMGKVADKDRQIDLTRLGLLPEDMIDRLSQDLTDILPRQEGI